VDLEQDLLVLFEIAREPARLVDGLPYSLTLLVILGAHELGHYWACRIHGIRATLPLFLPAPIFIGTFGAFIRMKSAVHSRRALFDVGLAGPLAGFLFLVPALGLGLSLSRAVPGMSQMSDLAYGTPLLLRLAEWVLFPGTPASDISLHPMARAAWVGMLATALNLLPIGQLDGGHLVYSLFGERHRWVSAAGLLVLIVLSIASGAYSWLVLAVVLAIIGWRHFRVEDDAAPGRGRWALFVCALLVFALSFTPAPVR
jgi:membrane-associated protease RseP (regulator of RpoE activity)